MKKSVLALSLAMAFVLYVPAYGHFQMIYSPDSVPKSKELNLKLVFTHPFEAGHTMDMGKDAKGEIHPPLAFGEMNKGKKRDLLDTLKPIIFKSLTNEGKAYEADIGLKGIGDHVFYFVPAPYYEGSEDIYIQHCTKVIFNIAGAPTDWDQPVGDPLPVEIVPLDKPYALWTGNVFRGIVTCKGKPVPYSQIEVEYLNHDVIGNAFAQEARVKAPHDALITMTIKADANGEFVFGIPKSGWWGFAALGAGGDLNYNGKELSQDAVIWVQTLDITE
ncbi:MAG: nickel transporter [delta proteobacterium ML8_D]|nr:MAG: nickel transporter [delta proteobacterium ML8_D]